jgi:hypothetical protein
LDQNRESSANPAKRMTPDQPQKPGLSAVLSDFGGVYFANAVVAFLFAASGPIAQE